MILRYKYTLGNDYYSKPLKVSTTLYSDPI